MEKYLEESDIIDWKHPDIQALASTLSNGKASEVDIAKKCFEWVRDNIRHSWDYQLNPVTCQASEVLHHRTGYCYAKSHLLGALLRANGIPCGFCYQRLSLDEQGAPYCLHGLNAVFLQDYGWYRIDARGNKEGVNAQFTPPIEQLAFQADDKLEKELPEIWPMPLPLVIKTLQANHTYLELYEKLPDIEVI
jgi:transglutaminase-like putative cysteine protease